MAGYVGFKAEADQPEEDSSPEVKVLYVKAGKQASKTDNAAKKPAAVKKSRATAKKGRAAKHAPPALSPTKAAGKIKPNQLFSEVKKEKIEKNDREPLMPIFGIDYEDDAPDWKNTLTAYEGSSPEAEFSPGDKSVDNKTQPPPPLPLTQVPMRKTMASPMAN